MTLRPWILAPITGVLVLVAGLLRWSHLPASMATHWGISGQPDGAMPRTVALLIPVAVAVVPVLFTRGRNRRQQLSTAVFASSLAVMVQVLQLWANDGASDWTHARSVQLWALPFLLGSPFVTTWLIGRRLGHDPESGDTAVRRRVAAPGQQLVWAGTAQNRVLLAVDLGLVAAGLVGRQPALVLAGVLALPFWRLRLSIGQAGAVLSVGMPAVLRRTYPLEQIQEASVGQHLSPSWGYRGSRKALGLAVWAIRRGECITLTLTDGSRLRITVDDAERGAAVLNGLLTRV